MRSYVVPLLFFYVAFFVGSCASTRQAENDPVKFRQSQDPWWNSGRAELLQRLQSEVFPDRAKNVIVFIGDGMGISTVTAARIFDGQQRNVSGEENYLSFEQFPQLALVKTYNSDSQVPDSAGTATAINTGIKAPIGTLNIFHGQRDKACGPHARVPVTLAEAAESRGMSTGLVTTTRVTHATPAAVFAHSPDRDWEYDAAIPEAYKQQGCIDIARQLVEFVAGDGLDVVLGGGRRNFMPTSKGGVRTDNRDLLQEWRARNPTGRLVENAGELADLQAGTALPVLGLFADSELVYESERHLTNQPSLADMTVAAIKSLATNPQGYYLTVEAGRIDRAHHETYAREALNETTALSLAVKRALELVDLNDTLVLVTADHSHTFVIGGYPKKGNSILGYVQSVNRKSGDINPELDKALDGLPYKTLGYFTGPRLRSGKAAVEIDNDDRKVGEEQWPAAVPLRYETHGGEDVALYANGAGSRRVSGVMEQHTIFHIVAHVLGLLPELTRSELTRSEASTD